MIRPDVAADHRAAIVRGRRKIKEALADDHTEEIRRKCDECTAAWDSLERIFRENEIPNPLVRLHVTA